MKLSAIYTLVFYILLIIPTHLSAAPTTPPTLPSGWIELKATPPNIYLASYVQNPSTPLVQAPYLALQKHTLQKASKIQKAIQSSSFNYENWRLVKKEKIDTCDSLELMGKGKVTRQTWCFGKQMALSLIESYGAPITPEIRADLIRWMKEQTQ